MLTWLNHLVIPSVMHVIEDDLLQGQAHMSVVSRILLLALLVDRHPI